MYLYCTVFWTAILNGRESVSMRALGVVALQPVSSGLLRVWPVGRLERRGGRMHPLRLSGQGEYIQRQKEARVITRIGRDTLAIGALVGDTDVSAGW